MSSVSLCIAVLANQKMIPSVCVCVCVCASCSYVLQCSVG